MSKRTRRVKEVQMQFNKNRAASAATKNPVHRSTQQYAVQAAPSASMQQYPVKTAPSAVFRGCSRFQNKLHRVLCSSTQYRLHRVLCSSTECSCTLFYCGSWWSSSNMFHIAREP
ncbi:hypothetical protein DMENIID0001_144580 [Sergentomyia squamirostris]